MSDLMIGSQGGFYFISIVIVFCAVIGIVWGFLWMLKKAYELFTR